MRRMVSGDAPDDPACRRRSRLLGDERATEEAATGPPSAWRRLTARVLPAIVAVSPWLMDRDRKSPGLKALQGLIWLQGYRDGELAGRSIRTSSRRSSDGAPPDVRSGSTRRGACWRRSSCSQSPTPATSRRSSTATSTPPSGPRSTRRATAASSAQTRRVPPQVLFISDVEPRARRRPRWRADDAAVRARRPAAGIASADYVVRSGSVATDGRCTAQTSRDRPPSNS